MPITIPFPIQWYEGMLMRPQHLQQMQLRFMAMQELMLSANNSFFWGIKHLKMDTSQVAGGILRIWEIEAVMNDGMYVYYNYELPNINFNLEIDLTKYNIEGTTYIHLCLPETNLDKGIANQSMESPRFFITKHEKHKRSKYWL